MKTSQFTKILSGITLTKTAQDAAQKPDEPKADEPAAAVEGKQETGDPVPVSETTAALSEGDAVPGDSRLVAVMNDLLKDEYTAIHEYHAHYWVAYNLGYIKFADAMKERMDDELKHADRLLDRIAFLGGKPNVGISTDSGCGMTIPEQLKLDVDKEVQAVQRYNKAIAVALEEGDNVTRKMFEDILKDEDDHTDELQTMLDQIQMMGLGNFLVTQL
jgi:bacterioferritin